MLADIVDAAQHKDLPRLESFHSYTPKFTKFEDDGLGRQDAEAGRKGEQSIADMKALVMSTEDVKVDVFGSAAVVTGILGYSVDTGTDKLAGKDRFTMVMVKDGGAWKIVHEHSSPLAPAAPAPVAP